MNVDVTALFPLLASALLLVSCDVPQPAASTTASPAEQKVAVQNENTRDFKQRQMEFLNRIRDADPQQRTVDRALLNDQNELGLILDRSVEMEKIPALMRTMLTQMAKEFPDQDLTVIAYTPSNPPRKMGTAHLDARTRDMNYTQER